MDFSNGIVALVILIFSAILHEVAHGYVADKLGDPTARLMGRLTLNPQKHIDLWMSIILPLLLLMSNSPVIFGAAKPVPIDPFNLREGRKDVAIVSLAGPLTNILIAIAAASVYRLLSPSVFSPFLFVVVQINILLAIFNLLPIPPLDGSKVLALLLPEKEANTYLSFGSIGFFVIFLLLLTGSLGFIFNLLNFAQRLLIP
ncbi:MAG TPA: site-2 protease family protein [Patescibacteria group bacterium]|nr:site-2 protease family protein [Patescibacteria group bacterium]